MAQKDQDEQRRSKRRKKMQPELKEDEDDPNIQVYQTITIEDKSIPQVNSDQENDVFYIDIENQVVKSLWGNVQEDTDKNKDSESEDDSNDESGDDDED